MNHRTPKSLRSKRGASIAEFVIIAPLLVLLGLVAYDLNKRIEDAQNIVIVTHNTVYLGSLDGSTGGQNTVRGRAIKSITNYDPANPSLGDKGMGKSVERDERREMALDPTQGSGAFKPGTYVITSKEDKLTSSDKDRAMQPNGIAPTGGTFASFYNSTMSGMNSALPLANTAMDAYNTTFKLTGLDAGKMTRTAAVQMRLSGESNALVRSIDSLGRIFGKEDGDGALTRNFSSRRYLISKTGYHAEDYKRAAYLGAGIGVLKYNDWNGSDFDRSSSSMQARCMTKLSAEDTCETGNGSRTFLSAIRALATVRMAISAVLHVVPPFGTGIAIDMAISKGGQMIVDEVVDSISSTLYNTLKDQIANVVSAPAQGIEQSMSQSIPTKLQSFGQDFLPDTGGLANQLGE